MNEREALFTKAQEFAKGYTANKPPLTDFQVEQIWLNGANAACHSTTHIAALRSALEMVEKIEQCAKYCQVCGVHKGDNRGCFAHRGAKGHKWAFQAHIKETELLAFKKALAGQGIDRI